MLLSLKLFAKCVFLVTICMLISPENPWDAQKCVVRCFFAYSFSHSDRFSYREPNWLVLLSSELTTFNVDLTHIHTWIFCFITYSNKQYKKRRTNKKARDNRVIDLIYLIAILWCVCKVLVVWYIVIKIVALKATNP